MLLKSLNIQGFKTFPDKTKLSFDNGMTAVVGPNGSGKSNISDAIRWVLGEQSPKSLRCSKMEDVVFNGTDVRKKKGFAEVTLSIDNKDRTLPFNGDDVAVTRRFYRSGESEYLINNASVRLKDINELFMDTGLGRDGYSMISQGKIDSIVASKSEDRREIFEEAAGISRYRYRKIEAERRLKSTEDNLLRLRDIVSDLEERVGPLKIQSEKAEKFLNYSNEKQGLEIALWLDTLNKSQTLLKEQEDKISVSKLQHEKAEEELEKIQYESENIYLKNGEYSSKIDDIRRQISDLEVEKNSKNSTISVSKNDILHNDENIKRINNEILQLNDNSENLKEQVEKKMQAVEELAQCVLDKQKEYNSISENLNNINITSGKSSDELQTLSSKLNTLSEKSADLRVVEVTSASAISDLTQRIDSLNNNLQSKKSMLSDLSEMKNKFIHDGEEYSDNINKIINSLKGLEIKIASKQKQRDELKNQSDKLMLDTQERLRRVKLLEDLERNLEGFSHSVKVIVKNADAGKLRGIHGPVSRVIKVPKEYTVAMETALGGAMQNIVTSTETDAKNAIRFLKQNDGGRATFLPIDTIKGRTLYENGIENCEGFVGIASNLCECNEEYKNILSSLLGRIVIADSLNSATNLSKKFGYKFKVVTLDGQVVNAGGSLTGGSAGRKSGLLSRASEIENQKRIAEELKEKSINARNELQKSVENYAKYEAELLGTRADLSNKKQEQVRVATELKACENELAIAQNSIDEIQNDLFECNKKIQQHKNSLNDSKEKIQSLNAIISETESKINHLSGDRDKLTEKREKYSENLQNIKLEIISFEKDADALKAEIEFANENNKNHNSKIEHLNNQINSYKDLNDEITDRITHLQEDINSINIKIDNHTKSIDSFNQQKTAIEKRTAELRQIERDKTNEREICGRELARLEERKINIQKQYDDIISKLWDEYELTRKKAEEVAVRINDFSSAQKRLNELKQKIKSLGSINVSSIEEYKEVSEKYEFMSVQVSDVDKSKNEIEHLIVDLTKQMKEVFVDSFNQINTNFTYTFKELFGGGAASLALSNPENILTSGIDMIVHPPGKIVVHLDALSGGEKALVAIALYFAIMKVRPAPFCVMDEIEAALDDVNVDRFAQYVRRMTNNTQFILITHRRGTMEEADVLYGVTMQDEGISKLLELRSTEVATKLGIKAN